MESATLAIKGMSCQHCVTTIEKRVAALPGVGEVRVDLGKAEAKVTFTPARTPLAAIVQAIQDEGYEAQSR